jgi:hypothetical protein
MSVTQTAIDGFIYFFVRTPACHKGMFEQVSKWNCVQLQSTLDWVTDNNLNITSVCAETAKCANTGGTHTLLLAYFLFQTAAFVECFRVPTNTAQLDQLAEGLGQSSHLWSNTHMFYFLGAFAKLRKATVSFMSVCPSLRMERLGSHWTDFDET